MILDQERADNWLTKGIGGAIDMIEQRSRANRFINRCFLEELNETANILDELVQAPATRGRESFDHTVCIATSLLVQILALRSKRSGLRGVDASIKDNLTGYARRLRESLGRLEPKD